MSTLVQLSSCTKAHRHGRGLMHWMKTIAAIAVLCTCSSLANAEVLLFSTASKGDFEEYRTAADASYRNAFVKLNKAGATKLSFTTTAPNQRVIINFSAVCLIGGPAPGPYGWILVTVLVDPAGSVGEFAAPPTDNPPFLCSGGNGTTTKMNTTVMASARPAVAGTHTVRVRVSYASSQGQGSTQIYLYDATLAVTR